jgi:uroporphyrinogen decarboxylase
MAMSPEEHYKKAKERFDAAIRHEKTDRIPILLHNGISLAKYYCQNIVTADVIERPFWVVDQAMLGLEKLKYIDCIGMIGSYPSNAASSIFLARMKLPGVELERDALWQIDEVELMTEKDYDFIIDNGWQPFFDDYLKRIDATPEQFALQAEVVTYGNKMAKEHGYVLCPDIIIPSTYDKICAGRGIINFALDMRKRRDRVKAVLDILLEDSLRKFRMMASAQKPEIVFIQPGNRANADFISRDCFEELVFPHFRAMANAAFDFGAVVFFHMDSNWTDFLDLFVEFPKNRCIFDTDGLTDIYKVKEVLGDRMTITGNIGPSLLTVGNPDDVYREAKHLIEVMGNGFIMNSACGLPPNLKPENLEAMVAACIE